MQANLDIFQKTALQYHETELRNLTEAFWSIAQTKYKQSRPENIGSILQERGNDLKNNLNSFYQKTKVQWARKSSNKPLSIM